METGVSTENKIKVSVIVPVYNSSLYLRQCLDSILNQTLKEIEIIAVDDGSTDDSLDILNEYQGRDSRIQIIKQENKYAGVARNNGMEKANGDYLVFWDSDDYFYETALEKLYNKITTDDADICVCSGNWYLEDRKIELFNRGYLHITKIPKEIPFSIKTNEEFILNFTGEAPWNKMYKKEFINRHELQFQPRRNGNDVYFVENSLCLADRITVVDEPLVCYRRNRTGALTKTLIASPQDAFKAWTDTKENLEEKGVFPKKSFDNKVMGSIVYLLHHIDSWDAFKSVFDYLQKEGLERLGIRSLEDDSYYQTRWHNEFIRHMENDKAEEFLAYFASLTYFQHLETTYDKKEALKENKALKNRVRKYEKFPSIKIARFIKTKLKPGK